MAKKATPIGLPPKRVRKSRHEQTNGTGEGTSATAVLAICVDEVTDAPRKVSLV
jgi:hypothetical protein